MSSESENCLIFCWRKMCQSLKWIWNDVKKPQLILIKIICMLQSIGQVALYPYLVVHMRSLGFSIGEISIVNLSMPLTEIIVPQILGLIADKIGNFSWLISIITLLNGGASLLLLTVSSFSNTDVYNTQFVDICCQENKDVCFDINSLLQNSTNVEFNMTCLSPKGHHFSPTISKHLFEQTCLTLNCTLTQSPFDNVMNHSMKMKLFWQYLAIRLILDTLKCCSMGLFDGAAIAVIKEHGGDIGLMKIFGTFGAIIFGPIAGQLIDWQRRDAEATGDPSGAYMSVILLYFTLRTISALCILGLNLGFKSPGKTVFKDLGKVFCKVEVLLFLFSYLMAGFLWGFIDNFFFWLMEDLGSTKLLMGLSLSVGTIVGIPVTFFSSLLVEKIGYQKIAIIALVLYSVRLAGFTLMTSPEMFLVFEILKPACTTLLFLAVANFIKNNSPETSIVSVQNIFGTMHFGFGRGMGGLIGGYTIKSLGSTLTFRIFAIFAASVAMAYEVLHHLNRCCKSKTVSELDEKDVTKPIIGPQEIEMTNLSQKDVTLTLSDLETEMEPLKSSVPPDPNSA